MEEKKIRLVKVKKRYNTPDPVVQNISKIPKATKNLTVLKKYYPRESEIAPGDLQEDFDLERSERYSNFLQQKNFFTGNYELPSNDKGPQFYDTGEVIPHTVVGSSNQFKLSDIPASQQQGFRIRQTQKTSKDPTRVDYEQQLRHRIQEIEQNTTKDRLLKKAALSTMPTNQRISHLKQEKFLRRFRQTNLVWKRLEKSLCRKTQKERSDLLASRAGEYREKVEELNFMERKTSSKEHMAERVWYMTLRETPEEKMFTHEQVGRSDIFVKIPERPRATPPVIVKPGTYKTQHRTFRDSEYFQQMSVGPEHRPQDLLVSGVSKLPLEIDCVNIAGADKLDLNLLELDKSEETIHEYYKKNYKI